jgi:hypothetical protein
VVLFSYCLLISCLQIQELSKMSKFENEIREEQEEKKRMEEEKALRRQQFLEKAAIFK